MSLQKQIRPKYLQIVTWPWRMLLLLQHRNRLAEDHPLLTKQKALLKKKQRYVQMSTVLEVTL